MKLPRLPLRIGRWDDYLPHLPQVEVEPERLRIKSPIVDFELKFQTKKEPEAVRRDTMVSVDGS